MQCVRSASWISALWFESGLFQGFSRQLVSGHSFCLEIFSRVTKRHWQIRKRQNFAIGLSKQRLAVICNLRASNVWTSIHVFLLRVDTNFDLSSQLYIEAPLKFSKAHSVQSDQTSVTGSIIVLSPIRYVALDINDRAPRNKKRYFDCQ